MRCLLEAHLNIVKVVIRAERALTDISFREQDIIVLDLDNGEAEPYRLLNHLMSSVVRPGIILTTALKSALKPNDTFLGSRVELLFHPVAPKLLLKALDHLSLRSAYT
ncbi:hypothetical protein ACJ3XI_10535 [Litorimonas sp. RW-G-Af-16]|uniref:hypothetical protein n=1 Tax=Litorimonas sp. RW-G-Af-16 TaxID=3241168 RepID=UPI00390C4DE5